MDNPVDLSAIEYDYLGGHFTETAFAPPKIPRGKSQKGRIAVFVDIQENRSTISASDIRREVVHAFYADPSGSFTSTLRRVLQQLNESVYVENEKAIRGDRTYASIACAIVRGDDTYLALVGPAICFGIGRSACERLGRCDPQASDRSVARIGSGPEIGVDLFHRKTSDLTTLLLASPGIVDLADGEFEKQLADRPLDACALVRRLGATHAGQRAFRSLAVTLGPIPLLVAPPTPKRSEVATRPEPTATSEPSRRSDIRRPHHHHTERPLQNHSIDPKVSVNGHATVNGRATIRLPLVEPAGNQSAPPRAAPKPMNDAIADARQVMRGLSSQSGRLLRRTELPRVMVRGAFLVLFVAMLFGLGYLMAGVASRVMRTGVVYADAVNKLAEAEQREREGMATRDLLARRDVLARAAQLAAASLQERPGSAAATSTLARIQKEIEAASGATPLGLAQRVVDLPTSSDQLMLNGHDLAVLDRATSSVYLYLLDVDGVTAQASDNSVLVRRGDHVGPATVGDMTALAWLPAGGPRRTGALAMLDRSGYLIQYESSSGLSLLALSNAETWSDVTAIRGSGGNLFVLNGKAGSIDWYKPQPTGFDGPVSVYLAASDGVNLTDAANIAVQNDVYVTHMSGTIDHFVDGKPTAVPPLPDDLVPRRPAGLAVGANSIFVGDPQHGRIIQLSRRGDYQRALKTDDPSQLGGLRDLALTDDGKYLYALSGTSVVRYTLPDNP